MSLLAPGTAWESRPGGLRAGRLLRDWRLEMSGIMQGSVIGCKEDKSFSGGVTNPTVIGHLKAGYYHVHDAAKVWPTGTGADASKGADPVTIPGHATTAWEHGAITEVMPANTVSVKFDIHWVVVSDASDVDDYELRLYKGASGSTVEIGRIAFARNATQDRASVYTPIQVAPIPANFRISASLASKATGRSCKIKLYYHTYPDIA